MKAFQIIICMNCLWMPLFSMQQEDSPQQEQTVLGGIVGLTPLPLATLQPLENNAANKPPSPRTRTLTWQKAVAQDEEGRKALARIAALKSPKTSDIIEPMDSVETDGQAFEMPGNISPLIPRDSLLQNTSARDALEQDNMALELSKSVSEQKIASPEYKAVPVAQKVLSLFSAYSAEEVDKYLRTTDPNISNAVGKTAVHIFQSPGTLKRLLEKGGNPNTQDINGCTPLHDAIENNQKEKIALLLDFQADVSIKNNVGKSPIDLANKDEIMRLLIAKLSEEKLVKILKESKNNTLLRLAVCSKYKLNTNLMALHRENSGEKIELFLLAGMNPNQKDADGNTPLHNAPTVHVQELLLSYGAKPDAKNNNGKTPLHTIKSLIVLKALLKNGNASLDELDEKGLTPLHQAVLESNIKRVKALLLYSCAKNMRDKSGRSVLDCAHNAKITNMLLKAGFNPHERNTLYDNGNTPLHRAQNSKVVNLLVTYSNEKVRVSPDIRNDLGQTPLHVHCGNPNVDLEVIRKLLALGADINAQDADGNRPLHYAICSLKTTMFLCSVEGINIKNTNMNGDTCIHFASVPSVIEYLKQFIDITVCNAKGETLFARWAGVLREISEEEEKLESIWETTLEDYKKDRIKSLQEHKAAAIGAIITIMRIVGLDLENPFIIPIILQLLPTKVILEQAAKISQAQQVAVPVFKAGSGEKLRDKKNNRLSLTLAALVPGVSKNASKNTSPTLGSPLNSPTSSGTLTATRLCIESTELAGKNSSQQGLESIVSSRPRAGSNEPPKIEERLKTDSSERAKTESNEKDKVNCGTQ